MKNIKLCLKYDGTNYHGWQTQPNGITIQETLETALSKLCGERIQVAGCSRTDAGVHAHRYICNFHTNSTIPPERFPMALYALLPNDIVALYSNEVHRDFHSRFDPKYKTYKYRIWNDPIANPFERNTSFHVKQMLDVLSMDKAAKYLIGKHDFVSFMAVAGTQKTTVRNIISCDVKRNEELVEILVTADGFLYNMVRIIAGTLVNVGVGKTIPRDMERILESLDRTRAGFTAPPGGLFLWDIVY